MSKQKVYYALWFLVGTLMGVFVSGLGILLVIWIFGVPVSDTVMLATLFIGAVVGLLFGYWAGPVAWRKIYIEGVRGKKYVIK